MVVPQFQNLQRRVRKQFIHIHTGGVVYYGIELLKKYIGRAKKANPFTASISSSYTQNQQVQTQPAKRLPSLPPVRHLCLIIE